MASENWPAYAKIIVDQFSIDDLENVERTEFADGSIRQQRRTTRSRKVGNIAFEIDNAERDRFRTWVRTNLNAGTKPFNINIPISGAVEAQIVSGAMAWNPIVDTNLWRCTLQIEWLE